MVHVRPLKNSLTSQRCVENRLGGAAGAVSVTRRGRGGRSIPRNGWELLFGEARLRGRDARQRR